MASWLRGTDTESHSRTGGSYPGSTTTRSPISEKACTTAPAPTVAQLPTSTGPKCIPFRVRMRP
eukprot:347746-Rhodomonas_salina.2